MLEAAYAVMAICFLSASLVALAASRRPRLRDVSLAVRANLVSIILAVALIAASGVGAASGNHLAAVAVPIWMANLLLRIVISDGLRQRQAEVGEQVVREAEKTVRDFLP